MVFQIDEDYLERCPLHEKSARARTKANAILNILLIWRCFKLFLKVS